MATQPRPSVLVAHASSELYGSDRVLLESLAALRSDGWHVVVTLPLEGPLVPRIEALDIRVEIVSVPVLRKTLLSPRGVVGVLLRSVLDIGRLIGLLRRMKPSLVYVNTAAVPLWAVAAFLIRRPILCHVHEAEEDASLPVRLAIATPLLFCRTVVANSAATAAVLTRTIRHLRGRIRVIHNGVPGPSSSARPPAEPAPRAHLLLVGRLAPRKGSDLAIAATDLLVRQGRDVELHLVGSIFPGYEWYEQTLRRAVRTARLEDRVSFHGFRVDAWPSYEMAHIVLVPSRGEPFGNVAVEAMLAGRPLVAARVQGLPEIVTDGVDGLLVTPDDPRALATAIAGLLDCWPRALSLADAGRRNAERRFGRERYAAEIVAAVADTIR